MIFEGVGVWIWQERYSPELVKSFIDKGVTHLIVRAWNGTGPIGSGFHQYDNYKAFVRDGRLPIVPWTYVYGPAYNNDPAYEATSFVNAVNQFDPPAVLVDIESEYSHQEDGANILFGTLREQLNPRALLAYSSFDLPTLHYDIPFNEIQKYTDVAVPQVYWAGRPIRGKAALARMYKSYEDADLPASLLIPAIQGRGITQVEAAEVAAQVIGISVWRAGTLEYDLAALRPKRPLVSLTPVPSTTFALNDIHMGAEAVRAMNRAREELQFLLAEGGIIPTYIRERVKKVYEGDRNIAAKVNEHFYRRG